MTIQPAQGIPSDCFLGCGNDYEVFITGRGGTSTVAILETTGITWSRVLDSVSTATVNLDISCCTDVLSNLHTWHHELLISRDGEIVWQGPIVELDYGETDLQILAWDVMGYLARRGVPRTIDFTATGLGPADLTEIARVLVDEAFSEDDPNVLDYLFVSPSGITGERLYTPDDPEYVLDNLNELARTGMDYTALGRRIILVGETAVAQLRTLTSDHFAGDLRVIGAGQSMATAAVVIGDGVIGRAGGVDPFYGLIEDRSREESILDQVSADAAAQARVTAGNPMPLIIDPSSVSYLESNAPVCINQLVPGVHAGIQLDPTRICRAVSTTMRLIQLTVTVDSSGEKVQPRFVPVTEVETV